MNFLLIQEAHLLPAARLKLQILPSQLRCCSLPCFPPLCLSSGMSVPVLFHKTLTEKLPGLKTLSVPTYLKKKQAFFYYWFPAEAVRYELASALTWQARLMSM